MTPNGLVYERGRGCRDIRAPFVSLKALYEVLPWNGNDDLDHLGTELKFNVPARLIQLYMFRLSLAL